ncbi:substrate-binding periplasmic protein [Siccirubricoccus phaeus]|uniref:substrate-binding periplasmic protein n=1 Tax=Siccirubricoccus phaeus TaxID=2595053 RepID=UPI0011F349B4|nr:ABC transporter substrate-binding protein [Siccirubricoccus phaeus]
MTDFAMGRRAGLAGLGMAGALVGSAAAQTAAGGVMEKIIREKQFKIGFIPSPPSVVKDPASGQLKGFVIDGVKFICQAINVEPVFVETTWANFTSGLNSGQFDLSVAGTFATILRASAVQFTRPIWYLGYSAVAKRGDTRFSKPADLNREGIRIALVQGGASVEYAKENWPKAQHILLATGNLTAPFVEVAAGRADVGVEDAWQARRFAAAQPAVVDLFGSAPYNVLPINWAIKRGNQDLVEFMNIAIDFLLTTGRWEKMAEPYGATGRFWAKPALVPFGPEA